MKRTRRSGQIGDVIRQELSVILRRDLGDPDIGFATITGVDVTTDLQLARVFVSVLGKEKQQKKSMAALEKAKGRIRHLLATAADLRYTPQIEFKLDHSLEYASSIENLLQRVKTEPERVPEPVEEEKDNDDNIE